MIYQELVATNQYKDLGYEIFYWRTTGGLEVDFILYGKRGIRAFEVKSSRHIDRKDLRGLREFKADYPPARCTMIYGGADEREMEDITLMPITKFLSDVAGQL